MVNAMRAPWQWNSYDIIWTLSTFNEDGSLKSPAYITALHNGVTGAEPLELKGDTPYNRPPKYTKHDEKGPISLQDHGIQFDSATSGSANSSPLLASKLAIPLFAT